MTQQTDGVMPNYADIMNEYYDEQDKLKKKALEEVSKYLTPERMTDLLSYLENLERDNERISDYRIEQEPPVDDFQEEYGFNVYVDQYASGESGDSFSGTISVEILSGAVYFKVNFEC